MSRVRWQDRFTNEEVRRRCGVENREHKLRKTRLRWFGQVKCRDENNIIRRAVEAGTVEPHLMTTLLIRPPRYYSHFFGPGKMPIHFLIKTSLLCDHPVYATNDHFLIPEVHFSLFLTMLIRPLTHAYKLQ